MNGLRHLPLINGAEPSWASLQVTISGVPVVGITGINYKDSQVVENIYGAGQQPVGRGYGNITPDGSITLLRSEVEAIRKASLTGRLQDIAPFDIVVMFIPITGGTIIKHVIRGAQFLEDGMEIKQGDTKNEVTMPLVVASIQWK